MTLDARADVGAEAAEQSKPPTATSAPDARRRRPGWGPAVRTAARTLLVLVVATTVFAAGWWSARTALDPPRDPLRPPAALEYTVATGAVEESFPVTAVASWPTRFSVTSPAGGVVTTVSAGAGDSVGEGEAPLTVDLAAVRLAQGEVPMFRDLVPGTRGPDVEQLQLFLKRQGHFPDEATGTFGATTQSAVQAWQRDNGNPRPSGSVLATELVFVPELPVRVRPTVDVGDRVAPGDPLYEVLAPAPVFRAEVTEDQLLTLTSSVTIAVDGPGQRWTATAGATDDSDPNIRAVELAGPDGGPVCAQTCSLVPVAGESRWPAEAITVPRVEGPQVPVGAIRTRADGTTYVIMSDGVERDVTVRAAAQGLAVVSGIDAGDRIQVPQAQS